MIDIRDKGATAGGNNSAAIQAAISSAATSPDTRTVLIPPGVWDTSKVTVPAGVTLFSDGGTLRHLPVTTEGVACVEIVGADATIRGLIIDGNRANQTLKNYGVLVLGDRANLTKTKVKETVGTGIQVSGRAGHRLLNCHVMDTGENGIGFTRPASLIAATDFSIHGALIERTNDGGIGVLGTNFNITGCTTRDTGGDGITAYADQNGDFTISGNSMTGVGNNGIHCAGSGATITGNAIKDCTHRGIYHLSAGLLTQETVVISSNSVTTTGLTGIEAWPCTTLAVTGNAVVGARGSAAIDIRRTDGLTVTGNTISKASQHAVKLTAVRNASIAANVGTIIGGDLIRVANEGLTPKSANGVMAANVGTMTGSTIAILDGSGWWTELATTPGNTSASSFNMGDATNRRLLV